ncbi:MAG: TonB family protein [Parvularculaceae bacterium]|nr:TonB family protein [Parvularculaceae bacterium]
MPKAGETPTPQKVTVVYKVNEDGAVEEVRVRETTDACFNEAAIAAVRSWKFEPARRGGYYVEQEDLETTFTFVINEEAKTVDFDARPITRYPPRYPERCMDDARNKETVYVEFDVTEEGDTENITIFDSTNSCLNSSALIAVKKWKYRPKLEDGKPVKRRGVQTQITYELASRFDPPPNRLVVGRKMNSIAARIRRGDDPHSILAELDEIELKYGDDFSRTELRAFHQLRGSARLSAKDYRGALDDFRAAQRLGVSGDAGEAIATTIEQLEAYIAAEDAAAAAENGGEVSETQNSPAPKQAPSPEGR